MTTLLRPPLHALAPALVLGMLAGCLGEGTQTTVNPTPNSVLNPAAPDEAPAAEAKAEAAKTEQPEKASAETTPRVEPTKPIEPVNLAAAASASPDDDGPEIALIPLKYDAFRARIKENTKAKYSMVDAWATWCAPCKENFPHVVEMHKKFADKGLAVYSLSMDHPDVPADVAEARKFLKEQKATMTNILLDEEEEPAFEKLNISAIPAVFIFGPDGAELKRFTMEDTRNQFTYEEVEKYVADLLAGSATNQPEAK